MTIPSRGPGSGVGEGVGVGAGVEVGSGVGTGVGTAVSSTDTSMLICCSGRTVGAAVTGAMVTATAVGAASAAGAAASRAQPGRTRASSMQMSKSFFIHKSYQFFLRISTKNPNVISFISLHKHYSMHEAVL